MTEFAIRQERPSDAGAIDVLLPVVSAGALIEPLALVGLE
jgi:hypothetical protein